MGIYKELKEKGWLGVSSTLNGSDYGVYGKMYELINTYDAKTGQFALANTQEAQMLTCRLLNTAILTGSRNCSQ